MAGNQAQLKLAAATLLLLPGRPFVYYGEEVGMGGGAGLTGDAKLRSPMPWTANASNAGFTTGTPYRALPANLASANVQAQAADPSSLLAHYKALMVLRNGSPAIARGMYAAPFVTGQVMGFQRTLGSERVLVLLNYGSAAASVDVGALPAGASLSAAFPTSVAAASADSAGHARIDMPAQSVHVFQVK